MSFEALSVKGSDSTFPDCAPKPPFGKSSLTPYENK